MISDFGSANAFPVKPEIIGLALLEARGVRNLGQPNTSSEARGSKTLGQLITTSEARGLTDTGEDSKLVHSRI